jgi:hypothetical protein
MCTRKCQTAGCVFETTGADKWIAHSKECVQIALNQWNTVLQYHQMPRQVLQQMGKTRPTVLDTIPKEVVLRGPKHAVGPFHTARMWEFYQWYWTGTQVITQAPTGQYDHFGNTTHAKRHRGVWKRKQIVCLEYWVDQGDDGHTDFIHRGMLLCTQGQLNDAQNDGDTWGYRPIANIDWCKLIKAEKWG